MSFKDVLDNVGRSFEGILGAVVIAEDGIIVERYTGDPAFDVELASVEYVGGCRDIRKAMESLESGDVEEVAVVTERHRMLLRTISPGYFLVLMLGPGASLGRGRYELKKASYALAPEFL